MDKNFEEQLVALGLVLPPEELAVLHPLLARYVSELEKLRTIELTKTEPPPAFAPWRTEYPA